MTNQLTVQVDGSLPGSLEFVLQQAGDQFVTLSCDTKLTAQEVEGCPACLSELLPPTLVRELRQWIAQNPMVGILDIVTDNSNLEAIPWEYIPQWLQMPDVFVVRRNASMPAAAIIEPADKLRVLVAGWPGKSTFSLPGIEQEMTALRSLGKVDGIEMQVLVEPDSSELADACTTKGVDILHLIPATIDTQKDTPVFILSRDGGVYPFPVNQFLKDLPTTVHPKMVVLNTCHGAYSGGRASAIHMIAERLGSAVIGWAGVIDDHAALDFARFLYARLFHGATIIDAIRSYTAIQATSVQVNLPTRGFRMVSKNSSYSTVPAVWTMSLANLSAPLFRTYPDRQANVTEKPETSTLRGSNTRAIRDAAPAANGAESILPELKVELRTQKWLNPALLRNGSPVLTNLSITVDRPLHNVALAVTCDTGSGTSIVRTTLDIQRGPQPIAIREWQFPVLFELIRTAVPRRQINFTVSCAYGGNVLAEITEPILWMDCTEWLDKRETWRFLPAFVNPYCDSLQNVVHEAYQGLQKLEEPNSRFNGYQSEDPRYIMQQVKAIFNTLRTDFQLQYMPPPPIPVFEQSSDTYASGQRIRTVGQVLEQKRGTCHDLAVLFASCLEYIQIYPLLVLVTGHTFLGFWKSSSKREQFWSKAANNTLRLPSDPGREWTIVDTSEIKDLLNDEAISLVDAVMTSDSKATFEGALEKGYSYFNETLGDNAKRQLDVAVDICASRREVQPL